MGPGVRLTALPALSVTNEFCFFALGAVVISPLWFRFCSLEEAGSAGGNGAGRLHNQVDGRLPEPSRRIQRSQDSRVGGATDGFPQ